MCMTHIPLNVCERRPGACLFCSPGLPRFICTSSLRPFFSWLTRRSLTQCLYHLRHLFLIIYYRNLHRSDRSTSSDPALDVHPRCNFCHFCCPSVSLAVPTHLLPQNRWCTQHKHDSYSNRWWFHHDDIHCNKTWHQLDK